MFDLAGFGESFFLRGIGAAFEAEDGVGDGALLVFAGDAAGGDVFVAVEAGDLLVVVLKVVFQLGEDLIEAGYWLLCRCGRRRDEGGGEEEGCESSITGLMLLSHSHP